MARLNRTSHWLPMATLVMGTFMPTLAIPQPAPAAALSLPTLGEAGLMTLSQERDLGDRIAREMYRDPSATDDLILSEYLDHLWQRLLMAARNRGDLPPELDARMAWRVVQIRDRTVNAFALPGGYFGIQYGLIAATQDRHELASVMAHELSHVTQRHIARSIDQQDKISPLMLAAMVAGAVAASKNPAAGQALMVGGQAAAIQQSLNFSRDMEREADRIGYNQMRDAGFSADGAVRMFERLQVASRLNDSGAWPYLRTHPLSTERLGDMQSRHAGQTLAAPTADLEHLLMAARARVLAEPSIDAQRTWAQEHQATDFAGKSLPQQAATLYQAAMAQASLRDFDQATKTAMQLLPLNPSDATLTRHAHLLLADLAQRQGDAPATLRWLPEQMGKKASSSLTLSQVLEQDSIRSSGSTGSSPPKLHGMDGRTATLWRAQAQLKQDPKHPQAAQSLQAWTAKHPGDAQAWLALSKAWQQQNQPLRALRAQAEASIAQCDWTGASDRLRAAQDQARTQHASSASEHIEATIIDTRLQWVSEKVREQALEDAKRR